MDEDQTDPTLNDCTADISKDESIFRIGNTDSFGCPNCKLKGDKWFMQEHNCSGQSKVTEAAGASISSDGVLANGQLKMGA